MSTSKKSIRHFRNTRGRPRTRSQESPSGPDLGTPELILKRAKGSTTEAVDLCLEKALISEDEHRSAMHLRWLHTIRYGAPGISAFDVARGAGTELHREDDPAWRSCRERDYHQAIELLRSRGYATEILPCVIYNERPDFLRNDRYEHAFSHPHHISTLQRQAARFAEGLTLLTKLWRPGRY